MHYIIYSNVDKTIPNIKTPYARQIKKNNYLLLMFQKEDFIINSR